MTEEDAKPLEEGRMLLEEIIRAKWTFDDATTLSEAAKKLRTYADELEEMERKGWQLEAPVEDDYGTCEKKAEKTDSLEHLLGAVFDHQLTLPQALEQFKDMGFEAAELVGKLEAFKENDFYQNNKPVKRLVKDMIAALKL
jgi:hypothetical protein